jgi:hypothetical protein
MMVLSGKAGEDGGYDFRANATAGRRRGARLETAHPSCAGHCLLAANYLFQGGVWQSIERNAPEAFKSAIALNPTGRMGVPEKVAASRLSRGRQPELRNQPHHRWRARQACVTSPILSGRLVRVQRAVCVWADRQGASPTFCGREFPRHNSQLAQLPSNCAPSLLGHQAVSCTTIGSFRCFRLQNGCGRKP